MPATPPIALRTPIVATRTAGEGIKAEVVGVGKVEEGMVAEEVGVGTMEVDTVAEGVGVGTMEVDMVVAVGMAGVDIGVMGIVEEDMVVAVGAGEGTAKDHTAAEMAEVRTVGDVAMEDMVEVDLVTGTIPPDNCNI